MIKLTQLQWDILDGVVWGADSIRELKQWELPRAKMSEIGKGIQQLQQKGFVRVGRNNSLSVTKLGELARDVIIAQDDLDEAQKKFNARLQKEKK